MTAISADVDDAGTRAAGPYWSISCPAGISTSALARFPAEYAAVTAVMDQPVDLAMAPASKGKAEYSTP